VPDDRSPIQHHLVLHRIDPEQGVWRFYSLTLERDLFGTIRLVRAWGRIGTNGQELVEDAADSLGWAVDRKQQPADVEQQLTGSSRRGNCCRRHSA
jgi:predicted DNA-binding WGR domain protein